MKKKKVVLMRFISDQTSISVPFILHSKVEEISFVQECPRASRDAVLSRLALLFDPWNHPLPTVHVYYPPAHLERSRNEPLGVTKDCSKSSGPLRCYGLSLIGDDGRETK